MLKSRFCSATEFWNIGFRDRVGTQYVIAQVWSNLTWKHSLTKVTFQREGLTSVFAHVWNIYLGKFKASVLLSGNDLTLRYHSMDVAGGLASTIHSK